MATVYPDLGLSSSTEISWPFRVLLTAKRTALLACCLSSLREYSEDHMLAPSLVAYSMSSANHYEELNRAMHMGTDIFHDQINIYRWQLFEAYGFDICGLDYLPAILEIPLPPVLCNSAKWHLKGCEAPAKPHETLGRCVGTARCQLPHHKELLLSTHVAATLMRHLTFWL